MDINKVKSELYPSFDYYRNQIKTSKCRCGYEKLNELSIQHYDHSGGWKLNNHIKKQWLYIRCPGCGYDWALWKLGVSRDDMPNM